MNGYDKMSQKFNGFCVLICDGNEKALKSYKLALAATGIYRRKYTVRSHEWTFLIVLDFTSGSLMSRGRC
jgi:hypothetical protein